MKWQPTNETEKVIHSNRPVAMRPKGDLCSFAHELELLTAFTLLAGERDFQFINARVEFCADRIRGTLKYFYHRLVRGQNIRGESFDPALAGDLDEAVEKISGNPFAPVFLVNDKSDIRVRPLR